jgi:polyisoprenoid-binding protein YceI
MNIPLLLLLIISWLNGGGLPVQKIYTLSENYDVSIHGTISTHDWTETIGRVSGELVGAVNGDGSVLVQTLRIVMQARSIKGNMGTVMNNKTYTALKGEANPAITFSLTGPVTLTRLVAGNRVVFLKGSLTLAGVTRSVTMSVSSFTTEGGTLAIEGEQKISMPDFGIKPPSALFGTMKASPEIMINFKTDFIIQPK